MRIIKRKDRSNRTVYRKDSVKGIIFYAAVVVAVMVITAISMGL